MILDRFRSFLKHRDDELRAVSDEVPLPTTPEIVQMYELLLSELTFNSKNLINDLTVIAEQQIAHAEGIADAICARIIEVPDEQKLPSMYLLDSIVKNVGNDYIHYFTVRLPEVFCEVYRQVHPSMHRAMRRLFETWSTVFPHSVLGRIEVQLQFSQHVNKEPSGLRASESPRPSHGIHVNPKYIHQFEGPNVNTNVNQPSSTPSSLKFYSQKAASGYDEYGADHSEVVPSRIGSQLVNSSGNVGRLSCDVGASMPHPFSSARLTRPSLPSGFRTERPLSSEVEEFAIDNSPGRFERVPVPDFRFRNSIERDEQMSEWQRKPYHDNKRARFEASTSGYDFSSGYQRERTRALINAYGNDSGQNMSTESLHVEYSDINGMGSKVVPKSWQTTEEEEFDWDKMGPSSHVRSKSNDLLGPSLPHPGVGPRPSFAFNGSPSDSNIRRSTISQLSAGVGSTTLAIDPVLSLDPHHGSVGKIPGFQANNTSGSIFSDDVSRFPRPYDSSQLSIGKGEKDFQIPLSTAGIPLTAPSRIGSGIDSSAIGGRLPTDSSSAGIWAAVNVHRSYPPPGNHMPPLPMQANFDLLSNRGTGLIQGENSAMSLPMQQQLNNSENKYLGYARPPHFLSQQSFPNKPNQAQVTPLPSQVARDQPYPHTTAPFPSQLSSQPFNQFYNHQGGTASGNVVPHLAPAMSLPVQNNSSTHFLGQGGTLRPFAPGLPPASSHMLPMSHNPVVSSQQPGGAFSGLIGSLMSQGLISLTKKNPVQDSVGLEFDGDLLKVRHESAISALYSDLPRQCTTCGLRFKCQEEHSSHMDWHVTKNRMSKNRKQNPSRKWFVSASMWLSGAEALGNDAVPGFLPTEDIVEKKDDEDLAVPVDDEQKSCALCGEPFEDFYSDETEEWMYKGAVYLNASNGPKLLDMDRSQLGPIVHAKCRPESNVVPLEGSQ